MQIMFHNKPRQAARCIAAELTAHHLQATDGFVGAIGWLNKAHLLAISMLLHNRSGESRLVLTRYTIKYDDCCIAARYQFCELQVSHDCTSCLSCKGHPRNWLNFTLSTLKMSSAMVTPLLGSGVTIALD